MVNGSCVLSGNGMRCLGICVVCAYVSSVGQGSVTDADFSGKRSKRLTCRHGLLRLLLLVKNTFPKD